MSMACLFTWPYSMDNCAANWLSWTIYFCTLSTCANSVWTNIPPPREECAGSDVTLTWGYTATQERQLIFSFDSFSDSESRGVGLLTVKPNDDVKPATDSSYPWTVSFTLPGTITLPNIITAQSGVYTCKITYIPKEGGNVMIRTTNTNVTIYSQCPLSSAFYDQHLQLGASKLANSSVVQVVDDTSRSLVAITPDSYPPVGVVFYRRVSGGDGTETTFNTNCVPNPQTCTASITFNNGIDYVVRSVYFFPALQDSEITFNINTVALTIDRLPSQHDVVVDGTLSLECVVKAKPGATLSWSYNGSPNLPGGVMTTQPSTTTNGNYFLTSSTLRWAPGETTAQRRAAGGRYTCTGGSSVGLPYVSSDMDLKVQYGPYNMEVLPASRTVNEGDNVVITCSAQCNPECSFAWINMTSGQPVTVYSGSTLSLANIKRHQQGIYRCRAQNRAGNSTVDLSIDVHYLDIPVFKVSVSQPIPQGSTLVLTCSVNSRPSSNITLTNGTSGDQVLRQSSGPTQTVTYTFDPITCWHAGTYICSADNGHTEQSSVVLDVSCPPGIYQTEPALMKEGANIGDNANFKLWVLARPKPNSFTWTFRPTGRQPEPNLPTNTHVISEEYTSAIFITKSIAANFGYYECVVENSIATSAPVIFELVPESKPSPPSNLTLVASTAVSMTVAWIPGWNGGSTQMFTLTCSDSTTEQTIGDIPDVTDDSGPWRGFVVQKVTRGVKPSTEYRFTVLARNEVGMSDSIGKVYRTTVRPSVNEGSLDIQIFSSEGRARLTGTISQGRVTYILVDACQTKPSESCILNNITEMTSSRRRRSLPVGEPITADINITLGGDEYRFNIILYDGVDLVYSTWTEPYSTKDGNGIDSIVALSAGVATGAVFALILIVVIVIAVLKKEKIRNYLRHRKKKQHIYETPATCTTPARDVLDTTYSDLNTHCIVNATYENVMMAEQGRSLEVECLIHDGKSYKVEQAKMNKAITVAVKRVKRNCVLEAVPADILLASIRATRALQSHDNIAKYISCTGPSGEDALVTLFYQGYDLNRYLRQYDTESTYYNIRNEQLTQQKMLSMSRGIVTGMIFLHSQEPVILHPNLSSYHIGVDGDGTCKVFGFLRKDDVIKKFSYDKQMDQLPVRWMAPEVLMEEEHTRKSDVWSFGILLWELLNPGKVPYGGMTSGDVKKYVLGGNKLSKPETTNLLLGDIFELCWMRHPSNRPSFSDIDIALETTSS